MGQTSQILHTLKGLLKSKGLTYNDLAVELGLSEASIKRLFSTESFSLRRLDQVCEFIGIGISDLTNMLDREKRISRLELDQELALVSNRKLMLIALLVINRWKFGEILDYFTIEEHELIRLLVQLDRLKLIVLLPGNSVKLLTSPNFSWIDGGPVHRFFRDNVQHEFFDSDFKQPGEAFSFATGMLSDSSHALFLKKLERLAQEFHDLCHMDAGQPLETRFGYSLVLAMRPWELSIFNEFRKP